MKKLISLFAFLLLTSIVSAQSGIVTTEVMFPKSSFSSGLTVTDKAINVTLDSTAWKKLHRVFSNYGISNPIYPDSMWVWTAASQANDSVQLYVHVDFRNTDIFGATFYTRVTVDSIKGASTFTAANQFQKFSISRGVAVNKLATALHGGGLSGAQEYRVVLSSTKAGSSNLLVGNSTSTAISPLPAKAWVAVSLLYKGGVK